MLILLTTDHESTLRRNNWFLCDAVYATRSRIVYIKVEQSSILLHVCL